MNTFGEIAEPISRTEWEHWDDDEDEQIDISLNNDLKWKNNINLPKEIDTLFVFEGKYLSESLKLQTHGKLELVNTILDVNIQLFNIKNSNKYICAVKDYDIIMSGEIVEMLKPYLAITNNILAIQTKSLADYQTTVLYDQDHVIRTISTSTDRNKFEILFPRLEQPNILTGVSAGVISLREHLNLPGQAVVCYMENIDYQFQEMQKIFMLLNLPQDNIIKPNTVLDSNLYI